MISTVVEVIASAALVSALGVVWYSPNLFGKYADMDRVSPEMANSAAGSRFARLVFGVLSAALLAYVMTGLNLVLGYADYMGAISLGLWCFAGFVVAPLVWCVIIERRTIQSFFVHALFWLIAFLLVAQIVVYSSVHFIAPLPNFDTVDATQAGE